MPSLIRHSYQKVYGIVVMYNLPLNIIEANSSGSFKNRLNNILVNTLFEGLTSDIMMISSERLIVQPWLTGDNGTIHMYIYYICNSLLMF